jgi:hypothetical protein
MIRTARSRPPIEPHETLGFNPLLPTPTAAASVARRQNPTFDGPAGWLVCLPPGECCFEQLRRSIATSMISSIAQPAAGGRLIEGWQPPNGGKS